MSEHLVAFLALPPSQLRVPRPAGFAATRPSHSELRMAADGGGAARASQAHEVVTAVAGADLPAPPKKVNPKDKELKEKLDLFKSKTPGIGFAKLLQSVKEAHPDWEFSTKRAKRILRTQLGVPNKEKSSSDEEKKEAGVSARATTPPRVVPSGPLFVGKVAGGRPNLFWRAVKNSDLRAHPLFDALPEPWDVTISSPADLTLYQQDSPQWDALHAGRLTTSRCAPVLGIYEPLGAKTLGVPASLSGHHKALDAFHKVSQTPVDFAALPGLTPRPASLPARPAPVWKEDGSNGVFPFIYDPPLSSGDLGHQYSVDSVGRARMIWGSTQEPTSILAAVNFFASTGGRVQEAGLCPLEAHPLPPSLALSPDGSPLSLPLMGASPDGVVQWPNGTLEAIEVKNHAPFREGGATKKSRHRSKFYLHDPGPWSTVAPWHIIQIQLEILCLGPQCRAANFMSCSATRGINVLRVARDDDYIRRMLSLVDVFHRKYVQTATPPPPNFAAEFPDYMQFLEETKRVAKSAKMVAHIPPEAVQRSPLNKKFFLDK